MRGRLRACSRVVESWPPEKPTTRRVPGAKRSGTRAAAALSARLTVASALPKKVVPPLPPGWTWRRRGGRHRRGRGLDLSGLGNQHEGVVAGFDQTELLASDRFNGRV